MDLSARIMRALPGCAAGICGTPGASPALVVNGSPRGISQDALRQLAGACSKVVAVDSGLEWLDAAGIMPTVLLGDMDSVQPDVLVKYEKMGIPEELSNPIKDETDLELALGFVMRSGSASCVAANVLGGRIDHALATIGALAKTPLRVASVDDDAIILYLKAGDVLRLRNLGLEPDDEYSIMAIDGPVTISQEGVAYPQDHEAIEGLNGRGVSNIVRSSAARVRIHDGVCALIVCLP